RKLRRHRFVAVVGTSGSGKSSLVRAGLLPALHGGFMTQAGSTWRIAVLRPGHDPIGKMARALNAPEVFGRTKLEAIDQATIIETTLRRGDLGLAEATRQARLPAHENLLIVVDQFEELFRFKQASKDDHTGDDAAAFVALLLQASKSDKAPIYVVLTMRSDFLGDCSQFRDLPEAMNEAQYLVPRLTRDQRRSAIAGPVAVGGGDMAPRLVQQLLNDGGDNPDQLPILQHALMRTWDYWSRDHHDGEPIDLDHYERIGGMSRALSLHADEAYEELPDDRSQKIAETLFKTLSERGPDNREIRRPTKLGQIGAIAEASEKETLAVIDTFRRQGRSFLMPPPDVALTPDTLIDVSHESLIRNWDLLKKWVAEEARSAQIYRRLAETAVLFQEAKAGYWRDPDLQIALSWREQARPNATWAQLYHPEFDGAMKFLDDSKAKREAETTETESARERELRQAQALAAEQGKAAKRLRLALALLTILLLAAIFAVIAFTQRQIAVKEAATAAIEKQSAERKKVEADSAAAAFAALFQEADSLQRIAAGAAAAEKGARLEAEQQRELAIVARDSAGVARERANAQATLAETRKDEAQKSQRQVQAVALAIKAQRLQQLGADTLSALLALESYRFDELSGRQFRNDVYDALRRSLNALSARQGGPTVLPAPTDLMSAMAFSPAGNKLAVGGADSTVQLLDLAQPSRPRLLGKHSGSITAVAFAPATAPATATQILASGGADYAIMIWPLRDGSRDATVLRGHDNRISSLAFSPSGDGLASGSMDGVVRWWDLQNTNQSIILGKHKGSVMSITFATATAPATATVTFATAGADKHVHLGNLQNKINLIVLDTLRFAAIPRALAFSPAGDLLAVGCEDGTTQLAWLRRGQSQTLRGHQKRVNAVAFSPNGNLLASGSSDKTIRLWNLQQLAADPIVLSEHEASIRSVAFTATGDTLIAGTFGKDIVLWLTSVADLAEKVRKQVQRNLTIEEWREFVGAEGEYPYGKK
ncbi:MAG: hypothetical protein ACREOI_00955, partial [bacterium]